MKKQTEPTGHSDLYWSIRKLNAIIGREKDKHPRTKVWKDLQEITEEIDRIQKDWFANHK
jgi:hypothetical protein